MQTPRPLSSRRINQLFVRAFALDALGRNQEAMDAYTEILQLEFNHPHACRAVLSLSRLLVTAAQRPAARRLLTDAAQAWPERSTVHAELATLLADEDEPAAARQHYERALQLNPDNEHAHSGLANLLLQSGETEAAAFHGRLGFHGRANARPYRGQGQPPSLLLVYSARGGVTPIEQFLDDTVFLNWILMVEFVDPDVDLPPHDIVFNCIADADLCASALDAASVLLSRTSAPVLNLPSRVRQTSRARSAERLARIPGVITAPIIEVPRACLLEPGAGTVLNQSGLIWPLLVRSPGFQLGRHFVKVDGPDHLAKAIESLPGTTLLVMPFIDTSAEDGKFRKYRVLMVGGKLYPLHLAVSNHWKVHYFSAQMSDSPQHRAEDEAFLKDMPGVLGPAAMQALERIQEQMGLDYGGIDFGLDRRGNVVVFEANASMNFNHEGREGWEYRVAPFRRVRQAVRDMLLRTAGRAVAVPV